MTIENKIAELKKLHPTLTKGINDQIVPLTDEEYDLTISEWAKVEIEKEEETSRITKLAADKAALLERLGITEDEAKLLLG
jgi:hypothetical protein